MSENGWPTILSHKVAQCSTIDIIVSMVTPYCVHVCIHVCCLSCSLYYFLKKF